MQAVPSAQSEPQIANLGAVRGPEPSSALALKFHGSAKEYFRIWAVNLCLTLLTLGVFSAWAKVRKKRYFYSHTTLDGTPFQYLGQPMPILKGRVVAAVLFGIYYASSNFFTAILPYVSVAGAVVAPWVIVRSAAFNARYSAFRNITFRFTGDYWSAFRVIYWWGLVPAILVGSLFDWWGQYALAAALFGVFGLAFPWWMQRFKGYIVRHSYYGGEHGEFTATGGQFFKVYFLAGLIVTAAAALTGLLAALLAFALKEKQTTVLVALVPIYVGYVLAFAFTQARIGNLVWNHTRLGPLCFESTLKALGLTKLYLTNALGILGTLGLLIPWAVIRTHKYRIDNLQVAVEGDLDGFQGTAESGVQATGAEVGEFFDLDLSL